MCHILLGYGLLYAPLSHAQSEGGGSSRFSQVGFFFGRVLPNGVSQEDEIFSMWGGRYSHPMGQGSGFYDFGFTASNSGGVSWKGLFTTLSMHIPVETLSGHAGIGLDVIQVETSGSDSETVLAGHFVGGVISRIGGNALLRADMKLTTKPGTTLFFGVGIVIELDGFGAGGGAAGGP